jgi:transcriptional regulator with XRE-family HTH domain
MLRSDRLKYLREQHGFTRQTLATALSLSEKQIWRYEAGRSDPTSAVVAKIAQILNVSTDFLLNLTDVPLTSLSENDLSPEEKEIVLALRRGDKLGAIKMILNEN